ncbi:DUF2690 domain-containing protein [Microcoleus sp. ZQ-A2]|nr:DUF2690 domain-containing protein [Microcoleus sp. FACHB-1]
MTNKRFFLAIGMAFLAVAVVDIYWTLTHQSPLCQKETCINLDARNRKCDAGAITILEEKFKETTIELRYSAKCDAGWARAVVPVGSRLYVKDAQEKKYGNNYVVPMNEIPGKYYGNMGPGRKLKACIQLPDNKHICTKLAK